MTKPRALSMFSSGLDSLVATKLMMNLGVEVLALHFTAPFIDPPDIENPLSRAQRRAAQIGVPLRVVDVWPAFLEILNNPRFGFGKNFNPCIDCKIDFFQRAGEIMRAEGFDFVFTGEVVGQRPMSQNRQSLNNIEMFSGLGARLVRPLSAKLLTPSRPEIDGLIDREKLLSISGRGRKPQLALAAQLGIDDPPGSGGGCLLTDGSYSRRFRHLLTLKNTPSHGDLHLLRVGRQLAAAGGKIIVSRNEAENDILERWAPTGVVLLSPDDWSGPLALTVGADDAETLALTAALMNRWGKPERGGRVIAKCVADGSEYAVEPGPLPSEDQIAALFIR